MLDILPFISMKQAWKIPRRKPNRPCSSVGKLNVIVEWVIAIILYLHGVIEQFLSLCATRLVEFSNLNVLNVCSNLA